MVLDIPWTTTSPQYIPGPHGILYTVGNICNVPHGIALRYIIVPHGILPRYMISYIPWEYTVGGGDIHRGDHIPWGKYVYTVGQSRFNDVIHTKRGLFVQSITCLHG